MTAMWLASLRFVAALFAVIFAFLGVGVLCVLVVSCALDDAKCRERWPGSHFQWSESWQKQCVRDQAAVEGALP